MASSQTTAQHLVGGPDPLRHPSLSRADEDRQTFQAPQGAASSALPVARQAPAARCNPTRSWHGPCARRPRHKRRIGRPPRAPITPGSGRLTRRPRARQFATGLGQFALRGKSLECPPATPKQRSRMRRIFLPKPPDHRIVVNGWYRGSETECAICAKCGTKRPMGRLTLRQDSPASALMPWHRER